jgi:hypothetical protein
LPFSEGSDTVELQCALLFTLPLSFDLDRFSTPFPFLSIWLLGFSGMKSKTRLVRYPFLFGNLILLAVSGLLVFAALLYMILNLFFGQWSAHPIYWVAFSDNAEDLTVNGFFGAVLLIWAVFAVLAVMSYLFRQAKPYALLGAKAVFTTLVAVGLMFGAYFIRLFQVGPLAYWETVDTVTLNAHTYHLLLYASDWAESWSRFYHLYECDSLDLFCVELTTLPQSTGGITPDVRTISLVADPASNALSIEVNGTDAFVHYSR